MKFRVVNVGLLIAMLINFVISLWIVEIFVAIFAEDKYLLALGITIAIFVTSIGILFTPVGDWWYRRIVYHLRVPEEWEASRLMPIYQEVYRRALKAAPNLPEDIQLFIYDDDDVNAFAIGLRTIAVHRGMLTKHIYDDEIAAILGHEFAHIANGDTLCTILAFQSSVLVSAFRSMFMLVIKIFAIIIGFFVSIIGDTEQGTQNIFTITEICGRGVAWITDKFLAIIVGIGVIIAQHSRRKHELQADNFTAELGYRQPMIHFFQRYAEADGKNRNYLSLAYLMYGTHPSMEKRIENLQTGVGRKEISL